MCEAECLFFNSSEVLFSFYVERTKQAKEGKGGTATAGIVRTAAFTITGMVLILAGSGFTMVFLTGVCLFPRAGSVFCFGGCFGTGITRVGN